MIQQIKYEIFTTCHLSVYTAVIKWYPKWTTAHGIQVLYYRNLFNEIQTRRLTLHYPCQLSEQLMILSKFKVILFGSSEQFDHSIEFNV